MNETLRIVDGQGVLRLERRFPHPVDRVWRAVTEPEHLRSWFPAEVELEPRVDGAMRFVFPGAEMPPAEGTVTAFEPPEVFAFDWDEDHFRIELRPDPVGCLLVFTHTFGDVAGAASFAAGWDTCLAGLGLLLDGKPPAAPDDMIQLHEHYVDQFGLAGGRVEEAPEGWRVHFERQLVRPVETVWATLTESLTGASSPAVGETPPLAFTTGEVPAGPVTAVSAPTLLEYEWRHADAPAGLVRWELTQGTGHGARLILTQTGSSVDRWGVALDAWRAHIELLAKHLVRAE